jgi:hypothetical protein
MHRAFNFLHLRIASRRYFYGIASNALSRPFCRIPYSARRPKKHATASKQ